MKELLRKEACRSAACFFEYLHRSDLNVNHIDLLTSLLIVYCFLVDIVSLSSLSGFLLSVFLNCSWCTGACLFASVGARVCVCVCVCVSVYVYTDRLLSR